MSALLVCLTVPLLVAVATGSSAAWWAVLAILPLVSVYTAVLYRARRLLAEKEMNAAFVGAGGRSEATIEDLFGQMGHDAFFTGAADYGDIDDAGHLANAGDMADAAYVRDEQPVSAVGGDW